MWGDISLWFGFAFFWRLVMLNIFSCTCWSSVYLLWENVYSDSLPVLFCFILLFLLLSCMSSSYILDINPLSDKLVANIFFHLVGGLFVLLTVSFAVQKLFSLMLSCLFIFAFVCLAWGDISKNNITKANVKERTASIFLQKFYGFKLYIYVFNPFWIYCYA